MAPKDSEVAKSERISQITSISVNEMARVDNVVAASNYLFVFALSIACFVLIFKSLKEAITR